MIKPVAPGLGEEGQALLQRHFLPARPAAAAAPGGGGGGGRKGYRHTKLTAVGRQESFGGKGVRAAGEQGRAGAPRGVRAGRVVVVVGKPATQRCETRCGPKFKGARKPRCDRV